MRCVSLSVVIRPQSLVGASARNLVWIVQALTLLLFLHPKLKSDAKCGR